MATWVDLSKVGVVLGRISFQGRRHFAAIDTENNAEQLRQLGFALETGAGAGFWIMPEGGVPPSPKRLGDIFGVANVRVVDLDQDEINARYRRARAIRMLHRVPSAEMDSLPVGMNYAGMTVYESRHRGRFFRIKLSNGYEVPVYETDNRSGRTLRSTRAAAFLYADTSDDLTRVTDGFVRRVLKGEYLTQRDLDRLIDLSGAVRAGSGMTRRDVQESVESSVGRVFSRLVSKNLDPEFGYKLALRLYEAIPTQKERTASSVANQQFSTPWPISFLAQRLLGDTTNKTVLEPTIGNRSLVSALPAGTNVYGLDVDWRRLELFGKGVVFANTPTVCVGDATQTDFKAVFEQPEGFDLVIANPPFGSLAKPVNVPVENSPLLRSLETKRLDHQILLRSLAARKDNGRSVFIVGADHVIENGEVRGRSKWLMNYLNDHYDLEGVVDVSGRLYQKMGAAYPIRLIVVGDRKPVPSHDADFPDVINVLHTHQDLAEWTQQLLAARELTEERQNVEPTIAPEPEVVAVEASAEAEVAVADEPLEVQAEEDVVEALAATEINNEAQAMENVVEAVDEALEEDTDEADMAVIADDFQRAYASYSRIGEATTMIPVNLAGPVYEALEAVRTRYGEIDEFVGEELEFSTSELAEMFSPEQVDALALAIAAKKDGKGFLLGDQMGVGKGRTLAAMARHAALHGETPVFVTVKPNLFSDFLERDLVDIRSRHLFEKPFIFNADTKILNRSGQVTVKSPKPSEYKQCFDNGELPAGTDIVFLTYSQLARNQDKSNRARLFLDVMGKGDMALLLDESHNGAGESNTSENLCTAISQNGCDVIYSSGTPIKGAKNLKLYQRVLPRGVDFDELLAVIQKDPISLQEALNHEIALSGCMISRELDNRAVSKDFVVSTDVDRNRDLSDEVSAILMGMSYLSGDVNNIIEARQLEIKSILKSLPEEDRKGSRMSVSAFNFGSRFHAISRQFLLAIKADDAVSEAIASIKRGEKPILAVQHTGESLLLAAASAAKEDADMEESSVIGSRSIVLDQPITFKDLLRQYCEKITYIKETGHYGDVSIRKANSSEVRETINHLHAMIDRLPNTLPLTPIDYFKHQMGLRGYKVGEISGRSLAATYLKNGGISINPVDNSDKSKVVQICRSFNDGELDAILLTASGSTGISLQASPANGKDLRPRRMIKWEPQQDIAVERQMDGRHNRTGQVVPPRYSVLLSGLPADDRLAMMFNNKNRSLTSSSSANRESKELIKTVPDLLNEVGNYVAERMFIEDHELAHMMDITIDPENETMRMQLPSNYYINRMTGRIMLLPYERQVGLYAELGKRFNERIEELTALGENPLQVKCHDWQAKIIDREIFMGEEAHPDSASKSQFDSPVYLTTVSYEHEMKPLRFEEIEKRVATGRQDLCEHPLVGASGSLIDVKNVIVCHADEWLRKSVSVYKFPSGDVCEALADPEPNETKKLQKKLTWLVDTIDYIAPGNVFELEQDNGELTPYIIVHTSLPKEDDFKRLGTWWVSAIRPGYDKPETFSLNALYTRDANFIRVYYDRARSVRETFDSCPNGKVEIKERLLDGNIFEAVAVSMRQNLGRKIVYTDENGIRQHGVLLRSALTPEKLNNSVTERIRKPEEVIRYLDIRQRENDYPQLSNNQDGNAYSSDSVRVSKTNSGEYVIKVPGTKANGGYVFLDPRIAKIEGRKEKSLGLLFQGNRSEMSAYVPADQVPEVLDFLISQKNISFYTVNRKLLKRVREELREESGNRLEV